MAVVENREAIEHTISENSTNRLLNGVDPIIIEIIVDVFIILFLQSSQMNFFGYLSCDN
jgi:hypothetical protein